MVLSLDARKCHCLGTIHRTDGHVDNDQEGTELPDVESARLEAVKFAGVCLNDDPERVWNGQEFRVEVTDDEGRVLLTVITLTVDAVTKLRPIPKRRS